MSNENKNSSKNINNRAKILVVEDDAVFADEILKTLSNLNYEISTVVNNGIDAIQSVLSFKPDLVLMDIQITGEIDGIQAATRIRELSEVPIVYLTSTTDEATLQRAIDTKPYAYVIKPFKPFELNTVIEIILNKHKSIMAERESAQTALYKSEEIFKIFINSMQDSALLVLDRVGNIVSWNRAAEKMTGYKADEVLNTNFSIFYRPIDRSLNVPLINLNFALLHGRWESEGWRLKKDGTPYWANIVIITLRNSNHEFIGFGKIIRDLTDKKKVEDALRESETRKTAILEASLDSIVSIDHEAKIIDFNASAERTFGIKRENAIGQDIINLIFPIRLHEFLRSSLISHLTRSKGDPMGIRREYPLLKYDGNEFPAEVSVVESRVNSQIFFTIFIRDITQQKLAADSLLKAQQLAEKANKTKSLFLASMSHEIRTPLGVILGFSDLLANPDLNTKDREKYISTIKRNGSLLTAIVNDILDLAKVEAGKLEIEKTETSLNEIIKDISSFMKLKASEKNIDCKIECYGELPERFISDSNRLKQILINIVGNAIKFTEKGEVTLSVKGEYLDENKCKLSFMVSDTGKGISPDNAKNLFQAFSREADSATKKIEGVGLGLVLARRLANLLDGDIELTKTVPGEGSVFTISLNVDRPTVSSKKSAISAKEVFTFVDSQEQPIRLDNVKVLLAEDSPDNQLLVTKFLTLAGASVEIVNNGREAVECLKDKEFDVVLMDIQMPEMDGYQATKILRREGFIKPIIALTAYALKQERQSCLARGFSDHISKPIDRRLLIQKVARYASASEPFRIKPDISRETSPSSV